MKFYLDSAQVHEIAYALEMWNLDGVTTNPRHVQASGKPFLTVIREIGQLFDGTDKPISVEVNPHLTDYKEMVTEGKKLAALCPNFVIKLPAIEAGFKAVAVLKDQGLDAYHTGHHQDGRPRAEQDGSDGCAHQVAGGAAGDAEVEHLPGKDGRCQHAHQWHLALAQLGADALQRIGHPYAGDDPQNDGDSDG